MSTTAPPTIDEFLAQRNSAVDAAIQRRNVALAEAKRMSVAAQQEFADEVRRLVASEQASVAIVAKRAGVSRNAAFELLRRYPATTNES